MEAKWTDPRSALEYAARRLTEGFDPDGGPFSEQTLRSFDDAGLTLARFHLALSEGSARLLKGARPKDIAASHNNTEFGWLVADVSESLRFDYEEGDAKDADDSLLAFAEAAQAGMTFSDLADVLPSAVARLETESSEVATEDESDLEIDEDMEELVDQIQRDPTLRTALGFFGRPK